MYEVAYRLVMDRRFRVRPDVQTVLGEPYTTLVALKAATPPGIEVRLIDELVHPFCVRDLAGYDLVGISSTTVNVVRAYQLLDQLRGMGVPTALGGIHATVLPMEAAQHADAVCVGEAEAYWHELLADLRRGELKPLYRAEKPIDMACLPDYDVDLWSGEYLPFMTPVFSRGCPYRCDFCAIVSAVHGWRHRPVDRVVDGIRRSGARHVMFTDATLFGGGRTLALELLAGLKACHVRWFGQTSVPSLDDDEVLDAMGASGCVGMGIGLESLSEKNLAAMNKRQNTVVGYEDLIGRIHDRGIAVAGDFLLGYDDDDVGVFDRTLDFTLRNGIEYPEVFMFVPYPGTAAHDRLAAEGRIVTRDWSLYTAYGDTPVFEPKHMSREVLRDGVAWLDIQCYSAVNIIRRLRAAPSREALVWLSNFTVNRKVRGVHGPWRGELLQAALKRPGHAFVRA
jgi:radical SAM superfamily enzyme YgiQ (UPF0313 family)